MALVHNRMHHCLLLPPLQQLLCGWQGLQVVMYGGETAEQDENVGNQDDSKSSAPVACNELCLLEPDNKLWVPMTITGADHNQCTHFVCCMPVMLMQAWIQALSLHDILLPKTDSFW